jgi:hypothetical protein
MGMEPFVAADDNAFGHLIGSIPDPVRNLREALAFKVGLDSRRAQAAQDQAQAAEIGQKLTREQMFQQDAAAVGSNPDAQAISSLMTKYPEFADKLKQGWDVKDKAAQQSDLTQLGEIYSAAASGNWDLAKKQAQARLDADKAVGQADPSDEQFLAQIDAASTGDNEARKAVLTMLGTHIASAVGPEHFASVYGALKGGYTLDMGAARYDDNGNIVAHSPLIKDDEGNIRAWSDTGDGAPSAAPAQGVPATVSPAIADVASTLSSTMPAPVVAGFMGNFRAEGGYNGAQGDGGSASGIGQWRGDRAANFERIIGKPVTEATPTEQAQFVSWEMQHPEQAGMTVKQRDAILNARTPAQAAALIDQYYERSSGRDRNIRMTAATAFAGDQAPTAATPAKPGERFPVLIPGSSGPDNYKVLGPDEVKARNLDPSQQYQLNTKTGQVTGLGKAGSSSAAPPGNPDLSGPDYLVDLKRQNPGLAAQVQGVLDTRLAYPPATARSPQAQQLRAAVLQAYPGYDEQAYARRKTTIQQYTPGHAGPGQSMLSAATIINHMYDLAQAARNLPDHTTAAQNAISAWYANQTNQPWLIKFNEGRKFVASELPKFLEGKAPTEGQVHEHYDSYSPSKGKSGIQTAVATDVDYLFGRFQPLIQAYKDNTGKDLNIDNYAPGQLTRAKSAALEYFRTNGALPTVVRSAAQAASLPHGAVFVTPDGRVLKRH